MLYTAARIAYESDKTKEWPDIENVYTVDMQKVLILPKMKNKNSFFVSRLIVMNETFAPLHIGKNKCVLWHEAIAGRSAREVSSTYHKIITSSKPEVSTFTFWSDNCSAQNKNWVLFTAFVTFVNSDWGPDTIRMKYFEPGHSFMKADAVHGKIGREWNIRGEILTMDEVADVILKAEKNNEVVNMAVQDFINFIDGSRNRRKADTGINLMPLLNKIKIAEFRKGSRSMFYLESYEDQDLKECSFLKKTFKLNMPDRQVEAKGLNTQKKKKIEDILLPLMHARKRIFWTNLPTSDNVADMCTYSE